MSERMMRDAIPEVKELVSLRWTWKTLEFKAQLKIEGFQKQHHLEVLPPILRGVYLFCFKAGDFPDPIHNMAP